MKVHAPPTTCSRSPTGGHLFTITPVNRGGTTYANVCLYCGEEATSTG